jgi:cyanophycinase
MLLGCIALSDGTRPGPLMLMGGNERFENRLVWDEFVRLAGGDGKRVAIFATATADPRLFSDLWSEHIRRMGLSPEVIPLSPLLESPSYREVCQDPHWIDRVQSADAILLLGGWQSRYREVLKDAAGNDTPMLRAIHNAHRRGKLVAGTSAGTAVMSRVMFVEGKSPILVLKEGVRWNQELDHGFGLMPDNWFVDQHFLARGRLARSLVAMRECGFSFGVGIDEDTALIVEANGASSVVGYGGVVLIDALEAKHDDRERRFNWKGVRLSYLSHGDQFNLHTRQVTVGPTKTNEFRTERMESSEESQETYVQYYNDIFMRSSFQKMLFDLANNAPGRIIGYCLEPSFANSSQMPEGFELHLTLASDSVGWESPRAIGDMVSVLNIIAEIRPVQTSAQRTQGSVP